MQRLIRSDFLDLLHLTSKEFDYLQHNGGAALAFGSPKPGRVGDYFDVDAACQAIALGLAPTFGREVASTMVLRFAPMMLATIARADADRVHEYFIGIGAFGVKDAARRIPNLYGLSAGLMGEIQQDFQAQEEPLKGGCFCNVTDILRRLRVNARALGIDLEGPFFYLPGASDFAIIRPLVEREIETRIGVLKNKADKRKLLRAKERRGRQDIKSLRTSASYPFEMVPAA
jgi:hypothetical protein